MDTPNQRPPEEVTPPLEQLTFEDITPTPDQEEVSSKQSYEPLGKPGGKFGPALWIVIGLILVALVGIYFLFAQVIPAAVDSFSNVGQLYPEPRPEPMPEPDSQVTEEAYPEDDLYTEEVYPEDDLYTEDDVIAACEDIVDNCIDNYEFATVAGDEEQAEAWLHAANLWEDLIVAYYDEDWDQVDALSVEAMDAFDHALSLTEEMN